MNKIEPNAFYYFFCSHFEDFDYQWAASVCKLVATAWGKNECICLLTKTQIRKIILSSGVYNLQASYQLPKKCVLHYGKVGDSHQ